MNTMIDAPVAGRNVCRPAMFLAVSAFWLMVGTTFASAQEVVWRYDYNSARREASEKSRPLLLDFGTEHCFWCNKLDHTTFRDPVIASIMNERFIPLKVDAQKNVVLTESLRIQSFPTIVMAGPDGKILDTQEGYLDANRFHERLQKVITATNNPEWMAKDYQEAVKASDKSDYARAVALLKSVVEDGQNRPVQVKARELLQNLEQQAANRLARAKQMEDKGQTSEALDSLTELVRVFSGTQGATDAGRLMSTLTEKPEIKAQQRTRRARELLAQAKEDYRVQQYLCCMDRCDLLASTYGDLPEGLEAIQLASEIKDNPEWMRQACDTLSERVGLLYLSLAETWLKKGQPRQAVLCLQRVTQAFPGTRQAEAAQTRLAQISGEPTRQADFKK